MPFSFFCTFFLIGDWAFHLPRAPLKLPYSTLNVRRSTLALDLPPQKSKRPESSPTPMTRPSSSSSSPYRSAGDFYPPTSSSSSLVLPRSIKTEPFEASSSYLPSPVTSRSQNVSWDGRHSQYRDLVLRSRSREHSVPAAATGTTPFSSFLSLPTPTDVISRGASTTDSLRQISAPRTSSRCQHCDGLMMVLGEMVVAERRFQERIADLECQVQVGAAATDEGASLAKVKELEGIRDSLEAQVRGLNVALEEERTNTRVVEAEKEAFYRRMMELASDKKQWKDKILEQKEELEKSRAACAVTKKKLETMARRIGRFQKAFILSNNLHQHLAAEVKKKDSCISLLENEREALRKQLDEQMDVMMMSGGGGSSVVAARSEETLKNCSRSNSEADNDKRMPNKTLSASQEEEQDPTFDRPGPSGSLGVSSHCSSAPSARRWGASEPLRGNLPTLEQLNWNFYASQNVGTGNDDSADGEANTERKRKRALVMRSREKLVRNWSIG
ncbi:hypothetical protein D9757_015431 [Collybiopsis confluens]|uniref:Uncharacterized protein n=1 Tax=Collybiopsis confluens TaxID=2823264 RepID=A0A8H5C2N9_9AGAR|nr:hypothetical protein D9757_015431 [Collybiopsis confluens]